MRESETVIRRIGTISLAVKCYTVPAVCKLGKIFMNYLSGELIEIGDRILLDDVEKGCVVCVIDGKQFTEEFKSDDWSHLKVGFLAEFKSMGLVHFEGEDETITLLEKGSRRPKI